MAWHLALDASGTNMISITISMCIFTKYTSSHTYLRYA